MTETPSPPIDDDDLHAYADGRLDEARAAAVAAHLEGHPEHAARIADYRRIDAALREAYGAPDEARGRARRRWLPVAAALAGLVVGAAGGWWAGRGGADDGTLAAFARHAASAYVVYAPDRRHPVEVGAAESDHLGRWLSARMGVTFRIPPLTDLGFRLIGGRLMVGSMQPAALLMYEDAAGRRLVVYVRTDLPPAGTRAPAFLRARDVGVVYWAEGARAVGVSGRLARAELTAVASRLRTRLVI